MDNSVNPLTFILIVFALHGLALALYIALRRTDKKAANRVLAGLLVVIALHVSFPKLAREFYPDLIHLMFTNLPLALLIGPLLYLYAGQLMDPFRLTPRKSR